DRFFANFGHSLSDLLWDNIGMALGLGMGVRLGASRQSDRDWRPIETVLREEIWAGPFEPDPFHDVLLDRMVSLINYPDEYSYEDFGLGESDIDFEYSYEDELFTEPLADFRYPKDDDEFGFGDDRPQESSMSPAPLPWPANNEEFEAVGWWW